MSTRKSGLRRLTPEDELHLLTVPKAPNARAEHVGETAHRDNRCNAGHPVCGILERTRKPDGKLRDPGGKSRVDTRAYRRKIPPTASHEDGNGYHDDPPGSSEP
jgi:hypothetical protein